MSISKFLMAAAVLAVPMSAASSFAGVLTFSDLPAGESTIDSSYSSPVGIPAGITVSISDAYATSGELPDHTGDSAAVYLFPGTENVDMVMTFSAPVEVASAYALRDEWGNVVTFTGKLGGTTVWTSPSITDFNTWVQITAGAGLTIDSLQISGLYARVDDITVNEVPEPASLGLLSIAGLGLLKRRR